MIERGHRLPLSRQADLLGISRDSLYYDPCPVSVADLAIMRRIHELYLGYAFAGSRMQRHEGYRKEEGSVPRVGRGAVPDVA